jgi:hypothetical protein
VRSCARWSKLRSRPVTPPIGAFVCSKTMTNVNRAEPGVAIRGALPGPGTERRSPAGRAERTTGRGQDAPGARPARNFAPLSPDETLEVTCLYSVAGGLGPEAPVVSQRRFRTPPPHRQLRRAGRWRLVAPRRRDQPRRTDACCFWTSYREFHMRVLEVVGLWRCGAAHSTGASRSARLAGVWLAFGGCVGILPLDAGSPARA